jgi:Spy/CpxP family protein refolding chaperone
MKKFMLAAAAVAALGSQYAAPAQAQSAYDDTQVLLSQIQTDRRAIVLKGLDLTDEEVTKFTPIYDEYQREHKALAQNYLDVINKFAANYDSMTDDAAKSIMKDWFKVVDERTALTKKYAKRFEKAMPSTKVMRWVQIENKLSALTNYESARIIPLTK